MEDIMQDSDSAPRGYSIANDSSRSVYWVGRRVKQVSAPGPQFEHNIGREGVVVDAFTDEKDNIQCLTDDGIWCPSKFMVPL